MPDVNIPLLRKAVEWAEAENQKSGQGEWLQARFAKETDCGTAYCIAGWVALNSGLRNQHFADYMRCVAGSAEVIEDRAVEELGLTGSQANDLFDALNTIEDVRRIAEDIAGERL